MENDNPRILVTTVGAWSDSVGSNTMSELVKDYDKDKLAALYIRADQSDSRSCERYFHIIEGKVLKSIWKRKLVTGVEYHLAEITTTDIDAQKEKERYSKYSKKRNWFYLFGREFVWLFGKWKSKELNAFLDDFKPEVLFFPIESYIHFNRINEYIVKRCHPKKVIAYMWDDNFTYKQSKGNFGFTIHRWWLRHSVKRLVEQSDIVFAICPKMKRELDETYGINSVLLTKPIYEFNTIETYSDDRPIKILYTGKLLYGRGQTLADIVDAIKVINKDEQRVLLQIYTNTELSPELETKINVADCCEIKGFVPQSQVLQIQKAADVLLYLESMSDKNLTARLSLSTKMTDYLSAGKCIWAVGNGDLAPIEYLLENKAGLISANKDDILKSLQQLIEHPELMNKYAESAQQLGRQNHNGEEIIEKFYNSLK